MSTRAVYTFIDEDDTYHVYKHHDGYPEGAVQWIKNALKFAWEGSRFEASEFGAAFIAGNKDSSGGVYLTHGWDKHGDLEFRYEIRSNQNGIEVTAFDYYGNGQIFKGTLEAFEEFTKQKKD